MEVANKNQLAENTTNALKVKVIVIFISSEIINYILKIQAAIFNFIISLLLQVGKIYNFK